MHLTKLAETYAGDFDPEIKGLTQDSRKVREGWLFAALPGAKRDGRQYIDEALNLGAVAILTTPNIKLEEKIALVTDENPRRQLAKIAAAFYKSQPEITVAVTGTNGKTSTVHFAQQLWQAMGLKAASMGTLSGPLTTLDPVSLHEKLADLAASGVTHLAMEASSHGLHQNRLDGVKASAAGFTNLSHDHLDYHKDMEDYLIAKAHLFAEILQEGGVAVLNADAPEFDGLAERVTDRECRVLSYGHKSSDIVLKSVTPTERGQKVEINVDEKPYTLDIPLVGEFQIMNALCALGLVMAEDPDDQTRTAEIINHLENLTGVPGRLELVPGHPRGAVYVDYAHTPDALENILKALRPHTKERLICLIGCGGDRDAGKRPVMGRIAAELSDLTIITDDNPRSENPADIRAQMMNAASGAKEIGGRREAITWAVEETGNGDVLVIAGKGHEQGQTIGNKVEPFDDVKEAKKAMGLKT